MRGTTYKVHQLDRAKITKLVEEGVEFNVEGDCYDLYRLQEDKLLSEQEHKRNTSIRYVLDGLQ